MISGITAETGDYITYDNCELNHTAEALEDTIILAIRWPSKQK
jgi:hypothetical protein